MAKIIIVSRTENFLMKSLQSQLTSVGIESTLVKPNMNAVSSIGKGYAGILLYLDEEMVEEQQTIIYLRDQAVEDDLPLILVDDDDNIGKVETLIPKHLTSMRYSRPLNVQDIARDVKEHIDIHGSHTKKKILVVDDSGAVLRNVKGWLEGKYQVSLANSGATAIKYLSMNRPDLVLLDYEMPVVDGKAVLGMIRSETEFADIPVIFLTNKDDKESIIQVMQLKPQGYLLKTQKPEQIVQAIDEFFEKQKKL